jgi:hypothetical protein
MRWTVHVGKIIDFKVVCNQGRNSIQLYCEIGTVMKKARGQSAKVYEAPFVLGNLLGTRSRSREECCHWIRSLPLVHLSPLAYTWTPAHFVQQARRCSVQNNVEGCPSSDDKEGNGSETKDEEEEEEEGVTLTNKVKNQRKCLTIIEAYGRWLDCDGLCGRTQNASKRLVVKLT